MSMFITDVMKSYRDHVLSQRTDSYTLKVVVGEGPKEGAVVVVVVVVFITRV